MTQFFTVTQDADKNIFNLCRSTWFVENTCHVIRCLRYQITDCFLNVSFDALLIDVVMYGLVYELVAMYYSYVC